MKKLIALAFIALLSTNVMSAVKCAPDGRGGVCCWDTVTDGIFKPVVC
ncbi:MAG: hypothetical protein RL373_5 [Pseudomonadota bacterium]|jgi:hypothetical protein